jgi:hypothetical protein
MFTPTPTSYGSKLETCDSWFVCPVPDESTKNRYGLLTFGRISRRARRRHDDAAHRDDEGAAAE